MHTYVATTVHIQSTALGESIALVKSRFLVGKSYLEGFELLRQFLRLFLLHSPETEGIISFPYLFGKNLEILAICLGFRVRTVRSTYVIVHSIPLLTLNFHIKGTYEVRVLHTYMYVDIVRYKMKMKRLQTRLH